MSYKAGKTIRCYKSEIRTYEKIARNEPCPCKSGKKYKHCCLKNNIVFRKVNK